jgi:carboxyl-terminal processing protease
MTHRRTSRSGQPITLRTLALGVLFGFTAGLVVYHSTLSTRARFPNMEQAQAQLHQYYWRHLDPQALEQAAIAGMMSELDEHSQLLSADAYEQLLKEAQGQLTGVGLEIGLRDGFFTVLRILQNSPAAGTTIEPGDRINRVDDEPVKGLLLTELIARLRGKAGTSVRLGFTRPGSGQHRSQDFELVLQRTQLAQAYLHSQVLADGVIHIEADQCYDGMAADIEKIATPQPGTSITGLILDLRNNPGGTLTCAVATTDLFLASGVIVSTALDENRGAEGAERKYRASVKTPLKNMPVVVLVNAGTASAAEIIAGALQDHKRATIVGSQTFAKGTVQTLLDPLPNGSALKITSAAFFTPNGRSFHSQGLVPDIAVPADKSLQTQAGNSSDIAPDKTLDKASDKALATALTVLQSRSLTSAAY